MGLVLCCSIQQISSSMDIQLKYFTTTQTTQLQRSLEVLRTTWRWEDLERITYNCSEHSQIRQIQAYLDGIIWALFLKMFLISLFLMKTKTLVSSILTLPQHQTIQPIGFWIGTKARYFTMIIWLLHWTLKSTNSLVMDSESLSSLKILPLEFITSQL